MKTFISTLTVLLLIAAASASSSNYCQVTFYQFPIDPDSIFGDEYYTLRTTPKTWSTTEGSPLDDSDYDFSFLKAFEVQLCTKTCSLTVWSTPYFSGRSQQYDDLYLMRYDLTLFPFCVKSYSLTCDSYPEFEEEEEEYEEEEEDFDYED